MPEIRRPPAEPARLPLSTMQRAFWFHEALSGDGGARAAVLFGLDFEPPVDVDRLDRALTAVVARHPLLRARLSAGCDGLTMSIGDVPGSILDRLPAQDPAALERWCTRPVSVQRWPLCRAALSVTGGRARLRVLVHHAVFDAESKDIFLRDLTAAYAAPERAPRSEPPRDAPFWRALVERERQSEPHAARERPPAGPLPEPAGGGDSAGFVVAPDLAAAVGRAAAAMGVTRFTLQLAAWHGALARLQIADDDIVTQIALSTRVASDATEIGPFLNQLPIRSTGPRSRSLREVTLELAQTMRRLVANRHQQLRDVPRRIGAAPEVAISYRRSALPELHWPAVAVAPVLLPALQAPSSDVVVRILSDGPRATGIVDVDTRVRPAGYARRLERCWQALLRAGTQRLDVRVGELALGESS